MAFYQSRRTNNNYHYHHNQLSADNPFRYLDNGTYFDPYKPKIINYQNIYPSYERKNDTQEEKKSLWSNTGTTSTLINNSYNIMNNVQNIKNKYYNYDKFSQQKDHISELFNYGNKENNPIFYSSLKNKKSSINLNPSKNNDFDSYSKSQIIDEFKNQEKNRDKNRDNNNVQPSINYSKTQMIDKIYNLKPEKNNSLNYYNKYDLKDEKNNVKQENVEEKISNIELPEYSENDCTSIKAYAYKENPNSLYRDYMEDKSRVIQNIKGDPNSSLFCLFDGHGGGEVSKFLQDNFYTYFKQYFPSTNPNDTFISLFKHIDTKIQESDFKNVGATACIIYITTENMKRCLYSANIGDTRSVLLTTKGSKRLSYDHRAGDINEYKRIVDNGGIIFNNRIYGVLMLSRAFGDWELKPYGVSCEPYITKINITDEDKYVIMGSDGIWDVVSDDDAFEISKTCKEPKELCDQIVQKAIDGGSMDNISCFVIQLN